MRCRSTIHVLTLFCLAFVLAPAAHAQTPATVGVCYGSTSVTDGDRLITIDLTTGAGTLVGDIVGVPAMSGLAINSAGDICSGHGRLP